MDKINGGLKMGGRPKQEAYWRRCHRCDKDYKTTAKQGKICADCNEGRGMSCEIRK